MSRVLIVYHSLTGDDQESRRDGGRRSPQCRRRSNSAGSKCGLVDAEAGTEVLVVATPQTFGTLAVETKKPFERLWPGKDGLGSDSGFASIVCQARSQPRPANSSRRCQATSASPP